MALKDTEGLRSFCDEISSDEPSPGGGTASAAAGAIAASLLAMVCRITRKSKRHEENWTELAMLSDSLLTLRDDLLRLAKEDSDAYEALAEAFRKLRSDGSEEAQAAGKGALETATEVPQRTAGACVRILEMSSRVADIGSTQMRSDIAVAVRLAMAGLHGAQANVRINLEESEDEAFNEEVRKDLKDQSNRATRAEKEVLSKLSSAQRQQTAGTGESYQY
ncbi:MAG: cyclodeaminase/cyclohydrolase family protein [Methanobacteriota archaeon]|nr:MAG: cyclodeaminase/cyclohydrolase family protein [Euryarchaeota archaeon]